MVSTFLIVGCVGGALILAAVGAGIYIIMKAGQRDTVSTAREGWIHRRSDKDSQGW